MLSVRSRFWGNGMTVKEGELYSEEAVKHVQGQLETGKKEVVWPGENKLRETFKLVVDLVWDSKARAAVPHEYVREALEELPPFFEITGVPGEAV